MIDVKLLITSLYTLSVFSQMVPLRGQDMINGGGNKRYYVPFYNFPLIFFSYFILRWTFSTVEQKLYLRTEETCGTMTL